MLLPKEEPIISGWNLLKSNDLIVLENRIFEQVVDDIFILSNRNALVIF